MAALQEFPGQGRRITAALGGMVRPSFGPAHVWTFVNNHTGTNQLTFFIATSWPAQKRADHVFMKQASFW